MFSSLSSAVVPRLDFPTLSVKIDLSDILFREKNKTPKIYTLCYHWKSRIHIHICLYLHKKIGGCTPETNSKGQDQKEGVGTGLMGDRVRGKLFLV